MASYAIYNYQFGKIVRQGSQLSLFPEDLSMSAENTFPRRQAILDEIFDNDYCGKERIRYGSKLSGDKEYIHRYVIKPTSALVESHCLEKEIKKQLGDIGFNI